MSDLNKYRAGSALGLIWSVGLLFLASRYVNLPIFTVMPTIMTAFFAPGIVVVLMIAGITLRRLFDKKRCDDEIEKITAFPAGSKGEVDQNVLTNTIEQLVAALCVWPAAAIILAGDGPGVIMMLGIGFAIARIAFWIGCHNSVVLCGFGFAATFFPTVLIIFWVFWQLATGYR